MNQSEVNDNLNKIAEKVISKLPKDDSENYSFVITVLMIISISLTLIRIIQECNKSKTDLFSQEEKYAYYSDQIKDRSIRKSWFTKMRIKKVLRTALSKEQYKVYANSLTNAILDTAETLNNEEIITLVEAANV